MVDCVEGDNRYYDLPKRTRKKCRPTADHIGVQLYMPFSILYFECSHRNVYLALLYFGRTAVRFSRWIYYMDIWNIL